MKTLLPRLIIGCAALVLIAGCTGPEEKSDPLLAEATHLVRSAQEAERTSYATAFTLYREALSRVEALVSQYPPSPAADQLIRGEVKVGSYTLAELRDTVISQAKAKAEAEADPLACAVLVAETTEDVAARGRMLADIAGKYANAGQHEQVVQKVKAAGSAIYNVLGTLIGDYLDARQYEQALGIARVAEDAAVRDWALDWIARRRAEAGQYDQALQVIQTLEDPAAKAKALSVMAGKYTEAGQAVLSVDWGGWRVTERWLTPGGPRWDPHFSLPPPYSAERAAELLAQALQVAETVSDSADKVGVLAEVARGYAAAGRYDRARQIIDTISDIGLGARVLTALAFHQAAAGQTADAGELLSQALRTVKASTDPSLNKVDILADIARGYVAAGQEERALQLAMTLRDPSVHTRVVAEVARKYAIGGREEQALRLAHTIADAELRAQAIAVIARQYTAKGQGEKATALLVQVNEDLPAIAREYAAEGDFEQALSVARAVREPAAHAEMLAEIARRCTEAHRQECGAAAFAQAVEAAATIRDPTARAKISAEIARREMVTGHPEQAVQ